MEKEDGMAPCEDLQRPADSKTFAGIGTCSQEMSGPCVCRGERGAKIHVSGQMHRRVVLKQPTLVVAEGGVAVEGRLSHCQLPVLAMPENVSFCEIQIH